jgi:glycosyltransferase involved in cell wall biosynthesis
VTNTPKVLFLGHEATRTGAPILMLQLLAWLKSNCDVQFEILLKKGGPLEADFAALAPTKILKASRPEKFLWKMCNRLGVKFPERFLPTAKAAKHARRRNIGLVYANTVAVADEVKVLTGLSLPVIWHVHELPFIIQSFGNGQPFRRASQAVSAFIAASEAVSRSLTVNYSIPIEKIKVIHTFISPGENKAASNVTDRETIRKHLALPEHAFVAGMCGTIEWRKGPDLFLAVASQLIAEKPGKAIYLLWIGGPDSDSTMNQVNFDIHSAGLGERVKFIGVKTDSRRYLAALDAFFLPSREDPFPLAMLEAASLGIPIVCFRGGGGGPEFVEADAGIVVDYGNTLAAAKALTQLREQPELCQRLGAVARQKVMARYTVENQAPKILDLINRVTKQSQTCMGH